ncbi:MAG: hypothetical protein JNM79_05205 [Burkholderiales bacterium]|nr:hypothetical protein [Burkholderiales bacterium]
MNIDQYRIHSAVVQIQFPTSYLLWDCAGEIADAMCRIWTNLELQEAKPDQQVLRGPGVQIRTGLSQCVIALSGEKSLEQSNIERLAESYIIWRKTLQFESLSRLSTRLVYTKEFKTLREANAELFATGLVKWPSGRVFEQPIDSEKNTFDLSCRFEDENAFSFIRLRAEKVEFKAELDPDFVGEPIIRTKCRAFIDFDRGLLGSVNAEKVRMDEWLKGVLHVYRRDTRKLLSEGS